MSNDNKQKIKKRFRIHLLNNRRLIIIVAAVIIIMSSLVTAYFVIIRSFDDEDTSGVDSSSPATTAEEVTKKRIAITKKVDTLVRTSGPESAQEYLNNELENAISTDEKAKLYIDKAVLAGSLPGGQDYSQAMEFALKADSLYPTEETALIIATIENNQNNIPNAIKYYRIYLDRAPKGSDGKAIDDDAYDYYYRLVSELEVEIK